MERALRPEPSSRATATNSSLSYDSYKPRSHSPAIREPVVREAESTSASAHRSSDTYRYDDPSKWRTEVTTYPTSQEAMSTRERQTVGYDDYRMGAGAGPKYSSVTVDTLRGPAPAAMPLPPVDVSYSTNIALRDLPPLQERLSEGVKVYKDKDERIRQSPPRSPPRFKNEHNKYKESKSISSKPLPRDPPRRSVDRKKSSEHELRRESSKSTDRSRYDRERESVKSSLRRSPPPVHREGHSSKGLERADIVSDIIRQKEDKPFTPKENITIGIERNIRSNSPQRMIKRDFVPESVLVVRNKAEGFAPLYARSEFLPPPPQAPQQQQEDDEYAERRVVKVVWPEGESRRALDQYEEEYRRENFEVRRDKFETQDGEDFRPSLSERWKDGQKMEKRLEPVFPREKVEVIRRDDNLDRFVK